jgi:SAM-dependent methyltransferase
MSPPAARLHGRSATHICREEIMKVFPFLKTVLDEVFADIPGETNAAKVALADKKAEELRAAYAGLASAKAAVNYKDPATRFAYILRYVCSHANMVANLVGETAALREVFATQAKVSVCCIGGGPGSDLVGVLKHVENADVSPKLMFWLFDREQAWSDSWADVNEKLDREVSTNFTQFDVTDPASYGPHAKYLKSDVFTMVYFVSEVFFRRDDAAPFFENLFAKAKPGALFLFIDNSSSQFYDWFDALWKSAGLKKLAGSDSMTMWMPTEEQKSDLGEHLIAMQGSPKLMGSVAYRVLKKE